MTEMSQPPRYPARSLHRKLAQVMYEAERIPKNGQYTGPGAFRFVQAGDAADVIRKALAEKNVSMIPTAIELLSESEHATSKGGTMTTMTVRTTWTLTDGETGETAVIQSMGSGADTSDKAAPKAQTNAMKYALLMGFLLSTGDDPELSDSSDRQRRPVPQQDGDFPEPTPPSKERPVETEELLGRLSKTGTVKKGTATFYDLEYRQTPDGHAIGFRLELDGERAIPQVLCEGDVGEALYIAGANLLGQRVTVKGRLFNVKAPGRTTFYRLKVAEIVTPDLAYPVPEGQEPLFSEDEQAAIDEALDKAPKAGVA